METPDVEGPLQHQDPPSAIIAANDRMALGVIAGAIDLHIPVPDFASVASDMFVASLLDVVRDQQHVEATSPHRLRHEPHATPLKIESRV